MKILKRVLIGIIVLLLVLFIALNIYARNPYQVHDDMYEYIDETEFNTYIQSEDNRHITISSDNPVKNIVFIPGGLVVPEVYEYLAYKLAQEGYQVTIFKPFYNLAILTPNYAQRYLSKDLENIVIGHSLGGVVGSMMASDNDMVDNVILLGSYPISDLSDKDVLYIEAEYDLGMDPDSLEESYIYVNEQTVTILIEGGNHAQFGWYGPQDGDGEATISNLDQQNITIESILNFIK